MKRICRLIALLALAVALLIPAAALAAEDALVAREGLDGFGDYVNSICAVGDTIWMYGGEGVYEYDAATGEMTPHPYSAEWREIRQGVYDAESRETVYRGVFAWFGWNDEVYALVNTSNGRGMTGAWLCRLALNEQGEASFESVGSIDWEAVESDGYVEVESCCVVNDVLCAARYDGLCFIPLDGSRAATTSLQCWQVCPFDGGLLAVGEEWSDGTEYVFYQVDVPSGSMTELGRYATPTDSELSGVALEPGGERLLFVNNGYLTALDLASGETERIAPVPISTQQYRGACSVVLNCGAYAVGGYEGVAVRQVLNRPASETVELIVGQDFWAEALDEAMLTFDRSHPNVTVAKVQASQIVEQLLTRSEDTDIFVMHTLYGQETALMDVLGRGYALELESDALSDYVGSMYPALREAFMRDGKVVGVPLSAQAMGLSVNPAGLEALGLTMDDVPTNWPDFLAFMNSLKGNGKAPVVGSGTDLLNARHPLLGRLLKDYQLEIQAGRQASWESPELRAALQALADVDFEGLIEDAQALESSWEGNPLVNGYDSVDIDGSVFEQFQRGYPLRLSLSAESPVVLPVMCSVAIVNPASRHKAEATALLEEAVGYVSHPERAMLCPDYGEPERDEAGYQRAVESIQRQIESQQARVDAGDRAAEADLANSLDFQAKMDNYYWIISQDSLDWYRAHDDDVMLEVGGELEAIDTYSVTLPAAENGIDPDALIAELEKKTQMMRLENN